MGASATVASLPHRSRVRQAGVVRDLDAAELAAAAFMRSLGVDPDDQDHPDLALTPRRLAEAYAELLSPAEFDFTTFANVEE
jgi:GTP cyclohydrolase I